jgi:hypothetical protein
MSMPMALMSSSMSGQCTSWPVPMISKCWRCSGVALDNRHDHASGTLMVRPADRCAVIRSSVTSTAIMHGAVLATMVMPCRQDASAVVENDGSETVQFSRRKSMLRTQYDRSQPKLTYHTLTAHVDMWRFLTNKPVEEKTIGPWDIRNGRHAIRLGKSQRSKNRWATV